MAEMQPKKFWVKGNKINQHINYAKYFKDETESESFKSLQSLTIHNMGSGYNCFVKSYALFICETEVKTSKSPVLKAFSEIKSVDAFKALNLPIRQEYDFSQPPKVNVAFEIDLS